MKHVVMFSGGIGSWAAAKRVNEMRTSNQELILLFSDVRGTSTHEHEGEDADTYRFIVEAAANVGGELVILSDGRTIWEVFRDRRFLGNSRQANCSHELKQKPARAWLEANCDPAETTVYVGIDWQEIHRLPAIERNYKPWIAKAPLTEPPYIDKPEMIRWAELEGLTPPRLYNLGFSHNNCGGGCVRAGQAQWRRLLLVMPERYAHWEAKEQEMRDFLGREVSILRESVNGVPQPLTLRELRLRLTDQPMLFDPYDIGACGCFVDFEEVAK